MQADAFSYPTHISSPGYERYWAHYNFMQSWMRKHRRAFTESTRGALSQCSCSHESVFKVPAVPPAPETTSNYTYDRNVAQRHPSPSRTNKREKKTQRRKAKRQRAISASSVSSSEPQRGGHLFHAELNEDFLAFMKESARHRQEREANKSKESEERMEVDSQGFIVDEKKRMTAPTEQPGMRRTHEMKMLYGEQSDKVHGMETAQQLCFQQACDKMKPLHWPNIPLKLAFS